MDLIANGDWYSGDYRTFGMIWGWGRRDASIHFNLCCGSSITGEVSSTCDQMIGTYTCHMCGDSGLRAVQEGTLGVICGDVD